MSYPIKIGAQTFVLADFAGLAYQQGIPDSVEAVGTMAGYKVYAYSTSVVTTTGTQTFVLDAAFAANVGDSVLLVDLDSDMGTGPAISKATISAYDGATSLELTDFIGGSVLSSNWVIFLRHESGFTETAFVSSHQGHAPNLPSAWVGFPDFWTQPFNSVPLGLLSPWPSGGFSLNCDFLEALGTSQGNYGPWYVSGNKSYTFNNQGHTVFSSTERGVTQQGLFLLTIADTEEHASLSYGNRGTLSVATPGDLFAAWAVILTADTGSAFVKTAYIGLRGDSSQVSGDIFSAYGIGFEIACSGTSKAVYGTVCKNGQRTKVYLGVPSGELVYYLIFVDRYEGVVYLKFTDELMVGAMDIPFDPTTYPMQVSLKDWPDTRVALLHPSVSVVSKYAAGTFGVYPERLFVFKQMER